MADETRRNEDLKFYYAPYVDRKNRLRTKVVGVQKITIDSERGSTVFYALGSAVYSFDDYLKIDAGQSIASCRARKIAALFRGANYSMGDLDMSYDTENLRFKKHQHHMKMLDPQEFSELEKKLLPFREMPAKQTKMENKSIDTLLYIPPAPISKKEIKGPVREIQKVKTLNAKLSEKYKDISVLADVDEEWGRVVRMESGNYAHIQVYRKAKSDRIGARVTYGKDINAKYMGTMVLPGLKADIAALDKLLNETLDPSLKLPKDLDTADFGDKSMEDATGIVYHADKKKEEQTLEEIPKEATDWSKYDDSEHGKDAFN